MPVAAAVDETHAGSGSPEIPGVGFAAATGGEAAGAQVRAASAVGVDPGAGAADLGAKKTRIATATNVTPSSPAMTAMIDRGVASTRDVLP